MPAPTPPVLLLVLSDEVLAEITSFRLELLGYAVHIARSAEEAMPLIRDHSPELLLLQLDLPGMSGPAFMEVLATENDTARIPVLAISTESDLAIVERTIAAGAKDYLVVPFDLVVLEQKVINMLAAQASADKTPRTALAKAQG